MAAEERTLTHRKINETNYRQNCTYCESVHWYKSSINRNMNTLRNTTYSVFACLCTYSHGYIHYTRIIEYKYQGY